MNEEIRINTFYPTHPHEKQQLILDALDSGTRFIQLRAGRKWRKTSLIISWLFEKALETGLTCPYIAPNRIQAKNIAWDDHIQRLLTHFKQEGLEYKKNEVELSIKLPKGGKVQLLGVENQEALRGISNWGAVGCDEYDDWEEDIWPTIIRPNLITHKAPAIIAGTPKGFKNLWRLEYAKDSVFTPFHYTSFDNPDIDKQELDDLAKEYMAQGMGAYRQEILAQYEKPQGTVYEEWDMEHQYIPLEYDPYLPIHVSWDFGVNDPTAVIVMQSMGSELRVIDYYEASDANIKHFTDWLDQRPYKVAEFEAGDIAGRARSLVTGKSPIDEARRLGHHIITRAIPDLEQQIRNAHKYIGKLFVASNNPNCERFRDCLLNYKYPTRSATLIDQSNEKPIHDEYSHAMRAFEYYCWNRTYGSVGAVTPQGTTKPKQQMILMRGGKQVSIDVNSFAQALEDEGGDTRVISSR